MHNGHVFAEVDDSNNTATDSNGNDIQLTSSEQVDDGSFHLITVVRESGSLFLYIDGKYATSGSAAGIADLSTNNQLDMGSEPYVANPIYNPNSFVGQLDEIQIYNTSLFSTDVTTLYAVGNEGGNRVLGNLIDTTADGLDSLPNFEPGVSIGSSESGDVIGGTTTAARNLLSGESGYDDSGNPLAGLEIADRGTTGNLVEGNLIGTDLAGTGAVANAYGVDLDGDSSGDSIGGTTAAERNIISGNSSFNFNGDTGANELVNLGTLAGVNYMAGSDSDTLLNPGTITGAIVFTGDAGADLLDNGATVNGVFVAGTVGSITYIAGSDSDTLLNPGTVTGAILFNGDHGAGGSVDGLDMTLQRFTFALHWPVFVGQGLPHCFEHLTAVAGCVKIDTMGK